MFFIIYAFHQAERLAGQASGRRELDHLGSFVVTEAAFRERFSACYN
jgi:hypothetical protein